MIKLNILLNINIINIFLIRKMEYLLALPINESSVQLNREETLQILEYFNDSNVCIKK